MRDESGEISGIEKYKTHGEPPIFAVYTFFPVCMVFFVFQGFSRSTLKIVEVETLNGVYLHIWDLQDRPIYECRLGLTAILPLTAVWGVPLDLKALS